MQRLSKLLALVLTLLASASVLAEVPVVFKHDQFSDSIASAAEQINGIPLATQPGWVYGEAFGALYKPSANAYPVKFTAVDIVMAAPPNGGTGKVHADIEFYFHDSNSADPGKITPDFVLSTTDVFDAMSGQDGMPLTGNTAISYEFDQGDPDGHPPVLNSGNFTVAVRFKGQAADLQAEWGTFQCTQAAMLGMCGCQQVGTLHDQATTASANVMHIIYPPGNCDGNANKWVFAESIGVTGDFILRVRATANEGPCNGDCSDKECGDDGCGGNCGECFGGTVCQAGQCVEETCDPACDGKECGNDGCGGECGNCADGESCVQGQCDAGGCNTQCDGKECGDDGCGGVCGLCADGQTCVQGACQVQGCQPDCANKTCGDDGCGGVCGTCTQAEACVQGNCQTSNVNNGELQLVAISPSEGFNDEDTEVSIVGKGFQPGATVKLGATFLSAVQVVSGDLISARVPAGMAEGSYLLIVMNSDAATATLPDAFSVRVPPEGATSGCAAGPRGHETLLPLVLLLGLLLVWRRRRIA